MWKCDSISELTNVKRRINHWSVTTLWPIRSSLLSFYA